MPTKIAAIRKLHEAVRRALVAAGVGAGDALVVGCSYGPDSLALADAVMALRRRLKLGTVTLCYVDHGLRPQARQEADQVAAFAATHGAKAEIARVTVDGRRGGGPEEAARAARYPALDACAR